jgi:regulatory protein
VKKPAHAHIPEEKRYQRALTYALRLLSFRQRTEKELEQRLLKKKYDPETVKKVCARLKAERYLDDRQFAQAWVRHRSGENIRSRWLLQKEMIGKGISRGDAAEIVASAYDETAVFNAACDLVKARLKKHRGDDDVKLRARLRNLLLRRGFSYSFAEEVLQATTKIE